MPGVISPWVSIAVHTPGLEKLPYDAIAVVNDMEALAVLLREEHYLKS